MKKDKNHQISSGNLFADIGIINSEERFAKSELAYQINTIIKKRNLTPKKTTKLLGINQANLSALGKGKLSKFSLEKLLRFLNILGQDIVIKVTPKTSSRKKAEFSINISRFKKKLPVKHHDNSFNTAFIQARKKS